MKLDYEFFKEYTSIEQTDWQKSVEVKKALLLAKMNIANSKLS